MKAPPKLVCLEGNLRRIFASVQRDYPRARRLGHTLVLRT